MPAMLAQADRALGVQTLSNALAVWASRIATAKWSFGSLEGVLARARQNFGFP